MAAGATRWRAVPLLIGCLLLYACSAMKPPGLSEVHLDPEAAKPVMQEAPPAISKMPVLPPPKPVPVVETYSVVASEIPVNELLFELARDSKLNVDIHPDIKGVVTLNAVKQTLPQIMDRIARQVDLRYQIDGPNLVITPDIPYWRTYTVNYVNLARESVSEMSVATKIATVGGSVGEGGSSAESNNISTTNVKSDSSIDFWKMVEGNLQQILGIGKSEGSATAVASTETGGDEGGGALGLIPQISGETGSGKNGGESDKSGKRQLQPVVITNPASGVISVRASHSDHQQVQHFLDLVLVNALRQVLIEMTIVEVELGDRYQAGVDWQALANGDGFSLISSLTGTNLTTPPFFSLGYTESDSSGTFTSTIRLLEHFGDVKVLSSPKIMALNNQTALLKVVDEKVYFTVDLEIEDATDNSPEKRTFTSQIHTVPVGMMMNVTPQITEDDNVSLNIRPTISRITGFAIDPAPALANSGFENLIPEIQIREMESLLQVRDGQMVVMGGLMQNKVNKNRSGLPGLSSLPMIGDLFSYRDDEFTKTELVIFLRPTVIRNAGLNQDLAAYRDYLPDADSWAAEKGPNSLEMIRGK